MKGDSKVSKAKVLLATSMVLAGGLISIYDADEAQVQFLGANTE